MYTQYEKVQINTPFVHLRVLIRVMNAAPPRDTGKRLIGVEAHSLILLIRSDKLLKMWTSKIRRSSVEAGQGL